MTKEVTTIRFDTYWRDKLDERAEEEDVSISEVVRRRVRFGLSEIEYKQLELLAVRQGVSETEIVSQAMKFMSLAMSPDLTFADAIKSMPELADEIWREQEEEKMD